MASGFALDVVDLAAVIAKGERPPEQGPYRILVGNQALSFTSVVIDDPIVTGGQILESIEVRPAPGIMVFQVLSTGRLEEIDTNERVDLRHAGVEHFLVFLGDSSYRIVLNDQVLTWGGRQINGATLKALAGAPQDHDVWEIVPGGRDILVGDKDYIDLTKPGVEHFVVKPFEATIIINAKPRVVHTRFLTYQQLVELAFPGSQHPPQTVYTIDYDHGPHDHPEGSVVDGQQIRVKEGMEFYVSVSDKS